MQISRGPLQSKVEEIFVPTDPEYLEDGPINVPVNLEFSIKTIMNRVSDKKSFQSKIVVIKLLKSEDKTSETANHAATVAA